MPLYPAPVRSSRPLLSAPLSPAAPPSPATSPFRRPSPASSAFALFWPRCFSVAAQFSAGVSVVLAGGGSETSFRSSLSAAAPRRRCSLSTATSLPGFLRRAFSLPRPCPVFVAAPFLYRTPLHRCAPFSPSTACFGRALFRRRAFFRPAFPCRRRNLPPPYPRTPLPAKARPASGAVVRGEIDKIFLENYGLFTMAKCTSKKLNFCLPGTPHCIFCKEQATTCSLTKKSQYL